MDIWLPQRFLIDLHNRVTLLKCLCEENGCIRYVSVQNTLYISCKDADCRYNAGLPEMVYWNGVRLRFPQ